jgi:hypothetical protein
MLSEEGGAAAQLLGAEVFSSPVITELTPGRVWEVTMARGDLLSRGDSSVNLPYPPPLPGR